MNTYEEVIDELPQYTTTTMMEDCVDKNLDNITRKYLNEINEIGVNEEEEEKKMQKMKI